MASVAPAGLAVLFKGGINEGDTPQCQRLRSRSYAEKHPSGTKDNLDELWAELRADLQGMDERVPAALQAWLARACEGRSVPYDHLYTIAVALAPGSAEVEGMVHLLASGDAEAAINNLRAVAQRPFTTRSRLALMHACITMGGAKDLHGKGIDVLREVIEPARAGDMTWTAAAAAVLAMQGDGAASLAFTPAESTKLAGMGLGAPERAALARGGGILQLLALVDLALNKGAQQGRLNKMRKHLGLDVQHLLAIAQKRGHSAAAFGTAIEALARVTARTAATLKETVRTDQLVRLGRSHGGPAVLAFVLDLLHTHRKLLAQPGGWHGVAVAHLLKLGCSHGGAAMLPLFLDLLSGKGKWPHAIALLTGDGGWHGVAVRHVLKLGCSNGGAAMVPLVLNLLGGRGEWPHALALLTGDGGWHGVAVGHVLKLGCSHGGAAVLPLFLDLLGQRGEWPHALALLIGDGGWHGVAVRHVLKLGCSAGGAAMVPLFLDLLSQRGEWPHALALLTGAGGWHGVAVRHVLKLGCSSGGAAMVPLVLNLLSNRGEFAGGVLQQLALHSQCTTSQILRAFIEVARHSRGSVMSRVVVDTLVHGTGPIAARYAALRREDYTPLHLLMNAAWAMRCTSRLKSDWLEFALDKLREVFDRDPELFRDVLREVLE